jgi:hypothetical protein
LGPTPARSLCGLSLRERRTFRGAKHKIISDQLKPIAVATADGKVYNGIPVVADRPNLVHLLSDGFRVTIAKTEIDEKKESTVSVMAMGLLDRSSYQEIADLLALFSSVPRGRVVGGEASVKRVIDHGKACCSSDERRR